MNATNDACRLDYLAGTLATAYKGSITSLVTRDFCMSDTGAVTKFTGTVLSMPDGDYEASLATHGDELSRCPLLHGRFEFTADSGAIAAARDLQIDIIQSGRHIGTFLLKKERSGGLFSSALELSEELAGVDLTRLSLPLRDKVGLMQRAEEIIALLHSTKKDWTALSEKLHGLSIDLFWSAPGVFSATFDILARFTLLAAERAGTAETSKPLANYFDLLDLALRQQPDRVPGAAALWTSLLAGSEIDLATEARLVCDSLRAARGALSGTDPARIVRSLIGSLRRRDRGRDFLDDAVLDRLGRAVHRQDVERLGRFGAPGRRVFGGLLGDAEVRLNDGDSFAALGLISALDLEVLDEHKALEALFELAEAHLSAASADIFAGLFAAVFSLDRLPDSRSGRALRQEAPVVLTRLLAIGRPDLCGAVLTAIEASGSLLNDQLLLDPKVADAVLGSDETRLKEQYIAALQHVVIPAARVRGISPDTWAEDVDPGHLGKLTAFLELLAHQDGRLGAVLVHVIANLSAGGVLIPDDRLFQRTVSLYLGSLLLREQFLPSILLLGRLPVYFNEVGAVNRIRDYSTELDSWGTDPVIYFLRKQVHVNASSRNVELVERLFASWAGNDASLLRGFVPPDILAQSDPSLIARYAAVISALHLAAGAACGGNAPAECLLAMDDPAFESLLGSISVPDKEAREKVRLLSRLRRELAAKYGLRSGEPAASDLHASIPAAVDALAGQKDIMLEPGRSLPQESLYFKRHIAFGIPSVLGSYHERKFDACGAFLRLGERTKVLFEQVIEEIEGRSVVSGAELRQWRSDLALAWQVLALFGVANAQIDEFVLVLERNADRLDAAQTADVLRMWQKELAGVVSALSRTFHDPIMEVLLLLPKGDLPDHLQSLDASSSDFIGKAADVVMRDLLSSIPGLVESDRLLQALLEALQSFPDALRGEGNSGTEKELPQFFVLEKLTAADALRLAPELGNKAKNLVLLKDRGLRVPAGVVLPALGTSRSQLVTEDPNYPDLLRAAVSALESATGAVFGGTVRPLFLSVRSGSYLSMPGILSSILYCGMNDESREAFIRNTGSPVLGWDSHRRFIEHYAAAVFGLDDLFFDSLAPGLRQQLSRADSRPVAAEALQKLVERYREGLRTRGLVVPDDPYEQLRQCVRAVYASWNSERARQFRSITGVSEAWGTAVTLMEMVSGNQAGGGASSFFTRDPVTLETVPYGETRELACGDDLASGRLSGLPLSRKQASGGGSLEERDPELFRLHAQAARDIEAVFGGLPQEIEATYARDGQGRPLLSVLQTRRMEQGAVHAERFAEICEMASRVIGHGTGANGGAVSGRASFARDAAAVDALRETSGMPVILLRRTADTDDVSLMPHVAGIVTAAGGVTSHAAVLAHKFGLAAVVACPEMELRRDEEGNEYALLGGRPVREGSAISIDGATGLLFSGECLTTTTSNREGRPAESRAQ